MSTAMSRSRRLARTIVATTVFVAGLTAATSAYATGNPTGVLEICKTASGSGVTGSFAFTVSGLTGSTSVPVGGCSQPLTVAAGDVVVTEVARSGFVVADITASPADRLISRDTAGRTAKVKVVPGSVANQTIVTFSNKVEPPSTGTLKVCKVAGPGVVTGQEFTFAVGSTTTTAKAGSCSLPLTLPVGNVTVTEQVPAAYEVTAIEVTGSGSLVSRDPARGTAVVGVAAGTTEVSFTNKKKNRPPVCTGVKASPGEIWPPNHKLVTVTLSGATDPDGDATTLTITGVTQDEALNGTGDGDTAPDAAWISGRRDQVQVRAERSGQGDGRVYRIAFTVSDGIDTCSGTVSVGVPHDQSGDPAVDTTSVVVNSFGP
ncbi:hypothetical protein [Actinoplanes sp. NPDC049681]|uniref:hypothetical protein n=1 Tax=Actinoplanes sp. NPDC049681 TaxID=3363905 RepID=UPI00378DED6B